MRPLTGRGVDGASGQKAGDLIPGSHNGVGTPTISTTVEGVGLKTATEKDGLWSAAAAGNSGCPPDFKSYGNGFTLYWRGNCTMSTTGNVRLLCVEHGEPQASPFVNYSINPISGVLTFAWNNGTYQQGANISVSDGFHSFAMASLAGGNVNCYVDGVLKQTNAHGSAPSTSATDTICICSTTASGDQTVASVVNLCLSWKRQLSSAELTLLESNPYEIFVPMNRHMPALACNPAFQADTFQNNAFQVS
jgi:hypothetical protein